MNFFSFKKMIQIVCCSCTQRKLRADNVAFYINADKKFYDNIDKIFVVPLTGAISFAIRKQCK